MTTEWVRVLLLCCDGTVMGVGQVVERSHGDSTMENGRKLMRARHHRRAQSGVEASRPPIAARVETRRCPPW
jgi:hypothetical protein